MFKRPTTEARAVLTTVTARKITDTESEERALKTARLRKARLERDTPSAEQASTKAAGKVD